MKLGIPIEKKEKEKKPKLRSKAKPKPKSKEKEKDLAEKIKTWGEFVKLNSEQIANNITQKYKTLKELSYQRPPSAEPKLNQIKMPKATKNCKYL